MVLGDLRAVVLRIRPDTLEFKSVIRPSRGQLSRKEARVGYKIYPRLELELGTNQASNSTHKMTTTKTMAKIKVLFGNKRIMVINVSTTSASHKSRKPSQLREERDKFAPLLLIDAKALTKRPVFFLSAHVLPSVHYPVLDEKEYAAAEQSLPWVF
eukprot:gb/GECG01013494.1/.p1 GENE.gb/GECG01013494.1/~~gb/GECG01013494.1/.p1  ORF type:complete len:156 (+),score=16.71 gb/GECG01013494.1/:1-468(+)